LELDPKRTNVVSAGFIQKRMVIMKLGLISPLFFLLVLVIIPLGLAQNSESPSKARKTDVELSAAVHDGNAELDAIARMVAESLRQPGFRGLVRSEVAQSKKREHIVELEDFLARAAKRGNASQSVKKLHEHTGKAKHKIKQLDIWDREGFDLYFPVKDHFRKWKGDADLYVAYAPYGNEEDVSEIYAYSVTDGNRYAFDRDAPPTNPVIIIAPCEHDSHDLIHAPNSTVKNPPDLQDAGKAKPAPNANTPGLKKRGLIQYEGTVQNPPTADALVKSAEQLNEEFERLIGGLGMDALLAEFLKLQAMDPNNDTQTHQDLYDSMKNLRGREALFITNMIVYNIRETWWEGDPEIYVFYADARSGKEHSQPAGSDHSGECVYMEYVDVQSEWYSTPQLVYISDIACSDEGLLWVMERDGGYFKMFSNKIMETNTVVSFWGLSGDDTIGTLRIHRSRYDYGQRYGESYSGGFGIAITKLQW
jgi:hypothetical protein